MHKPPQDPINRRNKVQTDYTQTRYERRNDGYTVIPANTPELVNIFYQLRYIVYNQERPELKHNAQVDLAEKDEFDDNARHFLLLYKPLHMVVGGARLIIPDKDKENFGLQTLGFENSPFKDGSPWPMDKMGEISRFLISKERMTVVRKYQIQAQQSSDHAVPYLHLLGHLSQACHQNALDGMFFLTTPSLLKMLNRFDFPLKKWKDPIEYHGLRQATYVVLDEALEELQQRNTKVYNFFKDFLAPEKLDE